jgi:hypothetical protein
MLRAGLDKSGVYKAQIPLDPKTEIEISENEKALLVLGFRVSIILT